MRICLVIASLGPGGAQRALSLMASHWARRGHGVDLVTFDPPESEPFFSLPPQIHVHTLGLSGASRYPWSKITANLGRVMALRRTIRSLQPDVAVGFMDQTNVLTLLAARPLGIPVVACERTDPLAHDPGRFWRLLRARTYPHAAAVAVQTEAVRLRLPESWSARAIPNPVAAAQPCGSPEHPTPRPTLLAVGRFTREKGHDLLLEAFARVAGKHSRWSMLFLGEGPERGGLEALRDRLGLADRVRMPGLAKDMPAQYRSADAFVLPSRYEGFPNALCEAMAHGLPCAAFDCPSGPGEIIRHEQDGLLVPPDDADALAETLDRLLGDADLRTRLAAKAPEVAERFSEEAVFSRWDRLLADITGRSV